MSMELKISNSDFIQKTIRLDGHEWRFRDRPYIFEIVNSTAKRNLLLAARQTEKSTTLSGLMLAKGCLNPNYNMLYVSPTMKQTGVFSRKKIDEPFETSPLLRKNFYPGVKGFRVEEKRLKNFTTFYFRSAFRDADSIRGITADWQARDEIQDILSDVIPVIEACSQKRKHAQFFNAGTPKTFDNTIHLEWEKSNQCEWHVKCLKCGHWNRLNIDLVLLDKPGLWCKKCQREIHTRYGCWVKARQDSEISGFRLPYIILPTEDLDFKELFFKMRNFGTAALMNEVFGESYDYGQKPITLEDMKACCSDSAIIERLPDELTTLQTYCGIDWGAGTSGFTVVCVGYPLLDGTFKYLYFKKFIGREAEPENLLPLIAQIIINFNCHIIGADNGFGFGLNDRLKRMIPSNYTYVTFMHSYIKKFVAYDSAADRYVTNRTEVMTEAFNRIKARKIEFFRWNDMADYAQDYLNINTEYSDRLRQMRYIHTKPDDSMHSGLYALLGWMISTNQTPMTRYLPGEDDLEGEMNLTD